MTLDGNDVNGPTVNHKRPLALGGALLALDNLEPAHKRCNSGLKATELPPVRSREW
jgi:5-methylcytosine-specific restriction endonuclease McrA